MRAASGLDAHDPLRGERADPGQDLRVLLRVDVVRDGADVIALAEGATELIHELGLAGTHRAADRRAGAHAPSESCAEQPRVLGSWRSAAMSLRNAKSSSASSPRSGAETASASIAVSSAAIARSPWLRPSGTSRTAAETRFAAKPCRNASSVGASAMPWEAAAAPTAIG